MRRIFPMFCMMIAACASERPVGTTQVAPTSTDAQAKAASEVRPRSERGHIDPASSLAEHADSSEAERQFEAITSNDGAYVVHVRRDPAVIERGATFALDVWIASHDAPERRLTDVELGVDAEMPEHQHGMNRLARVEKRSDGSFRVEALLFHMSGWWNLHIDVTRGAWTERAEIRIDLE